MFRKLVILILAIAIMAPCAYARKPSPHPVLRVSDLAICPAGRVCVDPTGKMNTPGGLTVGNTGSITEETNTLTFDDGDGLPITLADIRLAASGGDAAAIHDNVAGEIDAVSQEGSALEDGDALIGEDAQNSYAKIKILLSEVATYVQSNLGITAFGLSLTDDDNATEARSTLGLGAISTYGVGTLTDTYVCVYSTANGIACNTDPATFQTALTYPVTGIASPTAGNLVKWGASGNTLADSLKIGTFTDSKWCSYSTAGGLECTEDTPTGGGVDASSPIGATAFTDLNNGGTYTNFGAAGDDTINELFAAVDTAIGGLAGGHDALTIDASLSSIFSLGAGQVLTLTAWPTFNQNTSGTAAGLAAQYIDWNASSGGNSIANKPTIPDVSAYDTLEERQDEVGAMFSGNTETGIAITYQDIDGTIDAVVSISTAEVAAATLVTAAEGIASNNNDTTLPTSAAVKAYADGVAGAPANVTPVDAADENATFYIPMFDGATGSQAVETDAGITYNPSTNTLAVKLATPKESGVAGDMAVYEANSTDTHAVGFRGPASITGDGAYRGQFANAGPTEAAFQVWGASASGSGTAADPYIHAAPFITLDPLFEVNGSALQFKSTAAPTLGSVSFGADPGDSGAVRLSNNTAISWEQSTPGTDIFIALDSSDVFHVGQNAASISIGTSGTGNTTIVGDLTVNGSDVSVGAAGVKLTGDGDGAITLLGLGDGSDEDLTLNLDDVSNEVGVSSSTGVTALNLGSIGLISTGSILGAINLVTTTDGTESPTAAQMYGTMFVADHATATSDTDYTLPSAVAGMSACFYDNGGGTGGIIIDANTGDEILLYGTSVGAADAIDSPGVAGDGANGDFICLVAIDATYWITMGGSGTWVDGGAD